MVKNTKSGKIFPTTKKRVKKSSNRISTGIERMDTLLNGGFIKGDDILLAGPNFCGRDIFANVILAHQLKKGVPAIVILTDMSPIDFSRKMRKIYSKYLLYEKRSYVHYIDLHSALMGIGKKGDKTRAISYIDEIKDTNSLIKEITRIGRAWWHIHPTHILIFKSIHTLFDYIPRHKVIHFLQTFCGRTTVLKATSFYDLSKDAVSDDLVKKVSTFVEVMIEFRVEEGMENRYYLRVRGHDDAISDSWIEYKFDNTSFNLTGPFEVRVIR